MKLLFSGTGLLIKFITFEEYWLLASINLLKFISDLLLQSLTEKSCPKLFILFISQLLTDEIFKFSQFLSNDFTWSLSSFLSFFIGWIILISFSLDIEKKRELFFFFEVLFSNFLFLLVEYKENLSGWVKVKFSKGCLLAFFSSFFCVVCSFINPFDSFCLRKILSSFNKKLLNYNNN